MNSNKYYIFCINIIKSTKKFTRIQFIIIIEENMTVIREPKTFYFDYYWPKNVDEF